ncbi:unnamed protein product [Cylicostephanus goldi]|uniref:Uncharacterized protein n=1 Tax=Cylicostephanus goldi TaxID=71465 RepID=A0A3P6V3G2_CYLGO|nr:unnamed protein product [Cylicostephanus goldi]
MPRTSTKGEKETITRFCSSSAKEKTPLDDAADVGVVVSASYDFDLVAKSPLYGKLAGRRGSEMLAASDEHLRKTVDKVTHSCRHVEVKKEQTEMKVESEVVVVSQQVVVHQEESDAEPSGSVTPMRTDGEGKFFLYDSILSKGLEFRQ